MFVKIALKIIEPTNKVIDMNYEIPEEEVENILSVYWQLLKEVESKTDPNTDLLNALLVNGAYKVLRRAKIIDSEPKW